MERPIKLLFAGEGGQGIQAIAKLFSKAAYEQGLETIYIPNFGVEQRGGVSIAYVQVWDQPVDAPKFAIADFALLMSSRSYDRVKHQIGPDTKVVFDPFTVKGLEESSIPKENLFPIEAVETAKTQLTPRNTNIIMLGAMSDLTSVVDRGILLSTMHNQFDKYYQKNPKLADMNNRAFKLGERFLPGGETGEE